MAGILPKTSVLLYDGTKKPAGNVFVGNTVYGVDSRLNVVPSQIIKITEGRIPPGHLWRKISGPRRGAGRGKSFYAVTGCGINIWVPNKKRFVNINNIMPSADNTLCIKKDIELTPVQEQILLGKILGDGMYVETGYKLGRLIYTHSHKQKEYVAWTRRALGSINHQTVLDTAQSLYGSRCVQAKTITGSFIHGFLKDFYEFRDGKRIKLVPSWVISKAGPVALAFWYMDDGSLNNGDSAILHTCAFSDHDCEVLANTLLKFDIHAAISKSSPHSKSNPHKYNRLCLNVTNAEKFFLLVSPYIIPEMHYKLPLRYRNPHAMAWLPATANEFKPLLVEQPTVRHNNEVLCDKLGRKTLVLETTTNNYFANGVLVSDDSGYSYEYNKHTISVL